MNYDDDIDELNRLSKMVPKRKPPKWFLIWASNLSKSPGMD